jgi:hypothetical protein
MAQKGAQSGKEVSAQQQIAAAKAGRLLVHVASVFLPEGKSRTLLCPGNSMLQ